MSSELSDSFFQVLTNYWVNFTLQASPSSSNCKQHRYDAFNDSPGTKRGLASMGRSGSPRAPGEERCHQFMQWRLLIGKLIHGVKGNASMAAAGDEECTYCEFSAARATSQWIKFRGKFEAQCSADSSCINVGWLQWDGCNRRRAKFRRLPRSARCTKQVTPEQ